MADKPFLKAISFKNYLANPYNPKFFTLQPNLFLLLGRAVACKFLNLMKLPSNS